MGEKGANVQIRKATTRQNDYIHEYTAHQKVNGWMEEEHESTRSGGRVLTFGDRQVQAISSTGISTRCLVHPTMNLDLAGERRGKCGGMNGERGTRPVGSGWGSLGCGARRMPTVLTQNPPPKETGMEIDRLGERTMSKIDFGGEGGSRGGAVGIGRLPSSLSSCHHGEKEGC